jgi:hypothetical protein
MPGRLVIASETAEARAVATQAVRDATATRQIATLLDCDKMDFEILRPSDEVQTVAIAVTNVELTWRVRNNSTLPSCGWGQKGDEIQVLRAALIGGQSDTGVPVRLKWIQENEYDLSLTVQLSPGSYRLSWKLLLPKTKTLDGPVLEARVSVVALTPRPTFTPAPTSTLCPTVTYQCHCTTVCVGRECYQICDECTREKCN